jgi:hypothetical protein
MSQLVAPALDLAAVAVLVFGLYFPRHRRADMAAAFLGVNIGVLAVAEALGSTQVGAGLGLGLFGVLSIIRLRSSDIDHQEVAYYFSALALGLLGGLEVSPRWLTAVLVGAILGVLYVGDHPRLFGRYRNQVVTLDAAYRRGHHGRQARGAVGGRVHHATVRKLDLVHDTTTVEVRYELPRVAADDRADGAGPARPFADAGGR